MKMKRDLPRNTSKLKNSSKRPPKHWPRCTKKVLFRTLLIVLETVTTLERDVMPENLI